MPLLEELSKAFEVTVRGFRREIRGRTGYDAVGAGLHPRCDSARFSVDIRPWKPENQSYTGNQIDLSRQGGR